MARRNRGSSAPCRIEGQSVRRPALGGRGSRPDDGRDGRGRLDRIGRPVQRGRRWPIGQPAPRVHWCLVPASCIVASTSEVFLPALNGLPSNLVLVTGPSKSADIEQIIVTGVHGPVALELTVILDI
ncbi:MAG: LUD domain-containing protein [Ilumatobacteraceae bacterium]